MVDAIREISAFPSRARPATFSDDGDTFCGDLSQFTTDLNALAATSLAILNYKGQWSDLTGAAAIPYAVSHAGIFYMLNTNIADITAKTPGIDTEWTPLNSALEDTRIPTGTVGAYIGATAPAGWVLACGKTIGDASSGGTERANADTQNLFNLLWAAWTDSTAPIFTSVGGASARGATAAADWAAHKRMTVPDLRGITIIGLDNLGGTSANRVTDAAADTLGGTGGTESESNAHTASSGAGGSPANLSDGNALPTTISQSTHTHTIIVNDSTVSHVQPYMAMTKIVKL